MPRGRHRHSPPLHRLLPPSAIAGVSLVCALAPWVFTEPVVLRGLAAGAAVTAVVGAVVMRRWDSQAGKRVADLTRARASDEWRHEERVAELEADLDESRELRARLERRLRAKRSELAGLRNEHAALLRRYATAEAERASALEGRRLLAIEASAPSRALPPAQVAAPAEAAGTEASEEKPAVVGVFSPEGTRLFLRANAALRRFEDKALSQAREHPAKDADPSASEVSGKVAPAVPAVGDAGVGGGRGEEDGVPEGEAQGKPEAAGGHARAAAAPGQAAQSDTPAPVEDSAAARRPAAPEGPSAPAGHFTVPTAVAVAPAGPARRPPTDGGFDYFGTKKSPASAALEAVQNEDLADVVGEEALALHKAEAESKQADEEPRSAVQVIDLTAHDETERIDLQGLRSAVS